MDPEELLDQLLAQSRELIALSDHPVKFVLVTDQELELAEGIVNLSDWLAKGGTAPTWKPKEN